MAMSAAALREKSPDAFRTISEVATELDIPQHVLRFWESRFAQVRPIKRAGGRRYYRPEDVDLLRGIRALLYREGYTIKGAQKVMRDRGQRFVMELGRAKDRAGVSYAPIEPEVVAPKHARAVLAVVERAHPEPAAALAIEEREKLEILLAELLQLKSRLRAATARA
ncbi:MAG TPA: MerR family transcriptional regulator [Rhizomicrobium sp.]|nr:MerR family transcriptional regulator [Rhizomicrobium sp.]